MIIRTVKGDGTVINVPFNMRQVAGSLTGEALYEELMDEIANIRNLPGNATTNIEEYLSKPPSSNQHIEEIQVKLKQAASVLNLELVTSLIQELQQLLNDNNNPIDNVTSNT